MSATAPPQPGFAPQVPPPTGPAPRPSSTLATVIRSEWIKIRTVKSTFIILAVVVALAIGLGALIAWAVESNYNLDSTTIFDPTSTSLAGLAFGQLAAAVLGVMVVTSEYSTGMIRTSLIAVPRRGRMLAAKAGVFTVVMLVVGEVSSFIAFELGQFILKHGAPSASLGQPSVLRAVIGGGLYLALVGLLGVGVGALLRNTAGSIAIMVAFLFVVPAILSGALPSSVRNPVLKYWPTQAGSQIFTVHRDHHTLGSWSGFGLMVLFAAIILALATWLLLRRDA